MLLNGLWQMPSQQSFNVFSIFKIAFQNTTNNFQLHSDFTNPLPKPVPLYPLNNCLKFNTEIQERPLDLTCELKEEPTSKNSLIPNCSHPKIPHFEKNNIKFLNSQKTLFKNATTCERLSYTRDNGNNKYRTCKEFHITKSMLNGWLQKADKIQSSKPGALKSGRSGRRPQFPEIEAKLFHLYAEEKLQNKNLKVSNRWIRETAKELAQMQYSNNKPPVCQFSERWLTNFKKRYGISTNWNIPNKKTSNILSSSSI